MFIIVTTGDGGLTFQLVLVPKALSWLLSSHVTYTGALVELKSQSFS